MTYNKDGILYKKPEVFLLNNTNPVIAEYFGRTAYDSFDKSENETVKLLHSEIYNHKEILSNASDKDRSALLEQLSHVYFHGSVLEHINLSFFIRGISRGVLQELARHRIASLTVKSTRYTLSNIINSFVATVLYSGGINSFDFFYRLVDKDILVTNNNQYNVIVFKQMFDKLTFQLNSIGKQDFLKLALTKEMYEKCAFFHDEHEFMREVSKKAKRNVGDPFKHCLDENLSVDLGLTINLRSLKNFLELRLSGSAWFQIQVLAAEMWNTLPENIKLLLDDKNKFNERADRL